MDLPEQLVQDTSTDLEQLAQDTSTDLEQLVQDPTLNICKEIVPSLETEFKKMTKRFGKDVKSLFEEFIVLVEQNGKISIPYRGLEDFVKTLNEGTPENRQTTPEEFIKIVKNLQEEYETKQDNLRKERDLMMKMIDEKIGKETSAVRSSVFATIWSETKDQSPQPTEENIVLTALRNGTNPLHFRKILRKSYFNPDSQRNDTPYIMAMKIAEFLENQVFSVTGGENTEELKNWAVDFSVLESLHDELERIFPRRELTDLIDQARQVLNHHDIETQEIWLRKMENTNTKEEALTLIASLEDQEKQAQLNRIFQQIHERYAKEQKMKYIIPALHAVLQTPSLKSMDRNSVGELLSTVIKLVMNPSYQARITVGFGGTHDALNARVPAYTLAAAQLMEGLFEVAESMRKEIGQEMGTPHLLLISAHNAAQVYNGMDADITHRRATDNLNLARAYLSEFHPRVAEKTSQAFDTKDLYSHPDFLKLVDILPDDAIPEKLQESLKKMASHHSMNGEINPEEAWNRSKHYAAAHPAIFGDFAPRDPDLQRYMHGDRAIPDTSITIGGHPELRFNSYRRLIQHTIGTTRDSIGSIIPSVMFICAEGETPVYYAGEEPTLEQLFGDQGSGTTPKYSKVFYHDWANILKDIVRMRSDDKRLPKKRDELNTATNAAENDYMAFLRHFWASRTSDSLPTSP